MELLPEDLSTVEDFLKNEAFRRWVLEKRPEDRLYWQQWLMQYPEKSDLYEQAVAVFITLQGKTVSISNQQVKDLAQQILKQLPDEYTPIKPLSSWRWARWASAAAIISLIVWWRLTNPLSDPLTATRIQAQKQLPNEGWKLVRNVTGQPLVVLLPDNSSVLLTTGSQLRFRKRDSAMTREVFLQGEGFFEVTKDTSRPFIVYTNTLTTKVLGTSFQIRSFDTESTAFVKVKTGKVAVSSVNSPQKNTLLVINEQLVVKTKSIQVDNSEWQPIPDEQSEAISKEFNFDFTPVPEIFSQLEATYHMPIVYDKAALQGCTFTGQLNGVPFLEKIRLICQATESSFDIRDNRLVVTSRGCN